METNIVLVFVIYYIMNNNVLGQNCDFSNNTICNWIQSLQDDGNWKVTKLKTSDFTGPPTGHNMPTTTNNYYGYLDAGDFKDQVNNVTPNKSVVLISPELNGSGTVCFRFFYYMYGVNVNTLSVGVVRVNSSLYIDDVSRKELFNKKGDQGKQWFCGRISFNSSNSERIYMEAKTGVTFASNVAIDDLSFEKGQDCAKALPCNSTQLTTITDADTTVSLITETDNHTDFTLKTVPITTPTPAELDTNVLFYLISIPAALFVTLSIIAIVCYCKKSKNEHFNWNGDNKSETFENPQYEEAEVYDEIHEPEYNTPHDPPVDYNTSDYLYPVAPGNDSGPYNSLRTRREPTSGGDVGFRPLEPNAGLYFRPGHNHKNYNGEFNSLETDYTRLGPPTEQAPDRPTLPPRNSEHSSVPPTRCNGPLPRDYIQPAKHERE